MGQYVGIVRQLAVRQLAALIHYSHVVRHQFGACLEDLGKRLGDVNLQVLTCRDFQHTLMSLLRQQRQLLQQVFRMFSHTGYQRDERVKHTLHHDRCIFGCVVGQFQCEESLFVGSHSDTKLVESFLLTLYDLQSPLLLAL